VGILDSITPKYYKVITLKMERQNGEVAAKYHVRIYSVNGTVMTHMNPSSELTEEERDMIITMYQRDTAQFEAATGLEPWTES